MNRPVFIAFMDKRSQLTPEKINLIMKQNRVAFLMFDLSRSLSVDILVSMPPGEHNQTSRVKRFVKVLLIPGSVHNLEDPKHSESSDRSANHSLCLWSDEFRTTDFQIDGTLDYTQHNLERRKMHCISSLSYGSSMLLNFDYEGSLGRRKRSVYIALSPKSIFRHKLVMMVKEIRSEYALANFVQSELKNPTARFVRRHGLYTACSIREYDRENPKDNFDCRTLVTREAFEFENEFEFSNETMQFIKESCDSSYQREDDLFSLQGGGVMKEILYWHRDFEFFWNLSAVRTVQNCPIQAGIRLETAESPVSVEFSFSNTGVRTAKTVNPLSGLASFDRLNPQILLSENTCKRFVILH